MRRYGVSGLPCTLSKRALGDKNAAVLVGNVGLMGGRPLSLALLATETKGFGGDDFVVKGGRFQQSALAVFGTGIADPASSSDKGKDERLTLYSFVNMGSFLWEVPHADSIGDIGAHVFERVSHSSFHARPLSLTLVCGEEGRASGVNFAALVGGRREISEGSESATEGAASTVSG